MSAHVIVIVYFCFDVEEEGDLDLGLGKLISRRTLLAAAKRYEKSSNYSLLIGLPCTSVVVSFCEVKHQVPD